MASKTKACRDCHKGTDRPSQVCYHCAAVRENKARALEKKRADAYAAELAERDRALLERLGGA